MHNDTFEDIYFCHILSMNPLQTQIHLGLLCMMELEHSL